MSKTIKWSEIPRPVQATLWSWNAIPMDCDWEFPIQNIAVAPLVSALGPELASFDIDDDLSHISPEDVQKFPIMLDQRFKGVHANVADGHHRIAKAAQMGLETIPAIDVTPMLLKLGLEEARNNYPDAPGKEGVQGDEYDD